jgi:thioredoxin 1
MEDGYMSETTGPAGAAVSVSYELTITQEEASQGTSKLLSRNNKRLQIKIPAGVITGGSIKLPNALQTTDGRPGDIFILIKIKTEVPVNGSTIPVGVIEINDNSFESEVLKSALPVVVDFWADWCGPCRMMSPVVEKTAVQYQGRFKFCKINVDANPGMANRYQAMSIPMLLFFKNGQVIDKSVGAIPESQLKVKIDTLL